jgi:hypothetical protein
MSEGVSVPEVLLLCLCCQMVRVLVVYVLTGGACRQWYGASGNIHSFILVLTGGYVRYTGSIPYSMSHTMGAVDRYIRCWCLPWHGSASAGNIQFIYTTSCC